MSGQVHTRYTCDRCKSTRTIVLKRDDLSDKVFVVKDPQETQNGLIIFSDIHRCEEGFLGINNLYIDNNNAVRSFEYLTLPKEKRSKSSIPGIPSPNVLQDKFKTVRVTSIDQNPGFRLRIFDKQLDIILITGDVNVSDETPLVTLQSTHEEIILSYFEGEVEITDNLTAWLQELINLLEVLPPTKIGLFIDTLRYIKKILKIPPAKFHINMLKTILTSHKVLFELTNSASDPTADLEANRELYGDEVLDLMIASIKLLQKKPEMSLQEFTIPGDEDLSRLVYTFLLLEQDGVVEIKRPPELQLELN